MPFDKKSAVAHIQTTVNLLQQMEEWGEQAMLASMKHGLQGSKRENRFESSKDVYLRKFLQSEAMDLFGAEIHAQASSMKFPETSDPLSYLTEYCRGLWDIYQKLHAASNTFVAPLCLRDLAQPLYERCTCIRKAIIDIERKIKRYENMERYGTAYHDLLRQDTADESKHDNFEALEKSGVKYPG